MVKNKKVEVIGSEVSFFHEGTEDYISLTDLAKHKNAEHTGVVISHWLSTRYTIEFMGIWERVNNPEFNLTEFSYIRNESDSNGYVIPHSHAPAWECIPPQPHNTGFPRRSMGTSGVVNGIGGLI